MRLTDAAASRLTELLREGDGRQGLRLYLRGMG